MFTGRKKIKIQGKKTSHKKSLEKSLVIELIRNEKVKTTPKKAKLLKSSFDRLVTKVKKNSDHSSRLVISALGNNERAYGKLVTLVGKMNDRNSGYTRVIKTMPRKGDNAEQCYVILTNYEAKEKKSTVKAVLEKQQKVQEKKSEKTIGGRIGNAVSKIRKSDNKKVLKEKSAKTRRVST